ncbi:MAG: (2Fe-2S)-binding protein [Chloroflexi bacterium]|nr:(2Fe-2S)-binding protein [Chloroflexota bacterium]
MNYTISLLVNDHPLTLEVSAQQTLLEVLREELGLTGAKHGCDDGSCGACTVLLNAEPVYSCMVLAVEADGAVVQTIEGMRQEELHPLQQALSDYHGFQCGFCSAGMLITAQALLSQNSRPDEQQIRQALNGNLCRCTGYADIIKAIQVASRSRR